MRVPNVITSRFAAEVSPVSGLSKTVAQQTSERDLVESKTRLPFRGGDFGQVISTVAGTMFVLK